MAQTFTKKALTGALNGLPVKVAATTTPGTTIHTAKAGTVADTFDEVWLWAYNGHSAAVVLTIEFGGAAVPDQNIVVSVPFKSGLLLVVPGLILQNSLVVKAFAATANVITLSGFVNDVAP